MASLELPQPPLPKWQRPAKTKENLPWADIAVLDMGKYDSPSGKLELVEELRQAVRLDHCMQDGTQQTKSKDSLI